MGRPKKGEKGFEKANKRWRKTMLAKCGGKEGLHDRMVEMGRKGGRISRGGGFACKKVGADGLTGAERAKIAGTRGGKISRRGPSKEK